ncbi:hypothetical protein ACIXWY_23610 [Bacteroides fragilis]
MRAYIGTLSCKVYCLPATGGTWHGCNIIPVGTLPYMLHGDPAWRDTLHECNAPYMAIPSGNRQYIGAIGYAMYSCKWAGSASLPYTDKCIVM